MGKADSMSPEIIQMLSRGGPCLSSLTIHSDYPVWQHALLHSLLCLVPIHLKLVGTTVTSHGKPVGGGILPRAKVCTQERLLEERTQRARLKSVLANLAKSRKIMGDGWFW